MISLLQLLSDPPPSEIFSVLSLTLKNKNTENKSNKTEKFQIKQNNPLYIHMEFFFVGQTLPVVRPDLDYG